MIASRHWVTRTRRLGIVVMLAALLPVLGGAGAGWARQVHAQAPLSQEEQVWIAAVVGRIDRDSADEAKFGACLRRLIVGSRERTIETRFAAVRRCWIELNTTNAPADEEDSRDELLEGLIASTTGLAELNRLIDARMRQLLDSLSRWGATTQQIEQVQGRLRACLAAWGFVAGIEFVGADVMRLNEVAVDYCASDLPDFDRLRKTAPLIKAVGCPARVPQGRAFTCAAVIEGDATIYSWAVGAGIGRDTRSPQFTTTLNSTGPTSIELLACNGEPDADGTNCAVSSQSILVGPPLPSVSSPGCPSAATASRPITCTPTGVSNTTGGALWGWSSSGQIANDGAPVATITFAQGGAQTVSLVICNDRETCSDPVSQTVFVDAPALQITITTDKATYRVGDSITICWTVPAPGVVRLIDITAASGRQTIRESSGTGNGCFTGTIAPPAGRECAGIEYSGAAGTASAEACFTVEAAANASPSPTPRPSASPTPPSVSTASFDLGGLYRGSFSAPESVAGGIQRFQIDVARGSAVTVTKNTIQVTLRSSGEVLDATVELEIARTEQSSRLTGTFRGTLEAVSQVVIQGSGSVPTLILGTFQVRGTVATFTNGQPNRSQSETIRFYYTTGLTDGLGGMFNGTLLVCSSEQRTRDSCRSLPVATLRQ